MALIDLGDYLADDQLVIPLPGGALVHIPSPDAETGLWLQEFLELGVRASSGDAISDEDRSRLQLDDAAEHDLMARILGTGLQEAKDAGASWVQLQRICRFALLWFGAGPEAAEAWMKDGANLGESAAPNRAERRAASRSGRGQSSPGRASTGGSTSLPSKAKGKGKA